jgi:hypothetical protein
MPITLHMKRLCMAHQLRRYRVPARHIATAGWGLGLVALIACAGATSYSAMPPHPAPTGAAAPGGSGVAGPSAKLRPYATVIPATARTRRGLFTTHQIGDKLYFEIPARELNKDMLLVGSLARSGASRPESLFGYGGDLFAITTLRWERVGERILVRSTSFKADADSTLPIYQAVLAASSHPILAAFDIEAYGPDSAAVIEVTSLYTTATPGFGTTSQPEIGSALRGTIDAKRSFIERVAAFPDNIEIEGTQTIVNSPAGPADDGRSRIRAQHPVESVVAHWSMIRLPEQPMQKRWADDRVGFAAMSAIHFGATAHTAIERQHIVRWRLEKKDPTAPLSEPVKPIVYYIDPATPEVWKQWVKRGVEAWQPAFEAAGFKNAIVAKDPPTDDPDWSLEDIRNTVVRWLPSTVENATGGGARDPRTGEIINGTVRMYHNVLKLQRDWYFSQVAPLDPRAQRMPLPDSLMGRLLAAVVSHEVGHTLGLAHNQKGSSLYPADSVRSRTWVARMGHSPSIMDYSRYNYVAQPEDSIALDDLIPRIGPYDEFAIRWGYAPIPGARTPDDERPVLDAWARVQDTIPWYRYSSEAGDDYAVHTEAVGDADPVKSTGYGVKNIQRVIQLIPDAAIIPGEDNTTLRELYDATLKQWSYEMRHVASLVGGAEVQVKSGSQPGPVYTPISRARQAEAVQFLGTHAFRTPTYLIEPRINRRLEHAGAVTRIGNAQREVLAALLDDERMQRLLECEALAEPGEPAYTVRELLADIRQGIWTELTGPRVEVDLYRRNLQRAHLDLLVKLLAPPVADAQARARPRWRPGPPAPLGPTDVRPIVRGELEELKRAIATALSRTRDSMTRLHLRDVQLELERLLDPRGAFAYSGKS